MSAETDSADDLFLRTADALPEHAGHAVTDIEARRLGELGVRDAAGLRTATAWTARRRAALLRAGRIAR